MIDRFVRDGKMTAETVVALVVTILRTLTDRSAIRTAYALALDYGTVADTDRASLHNAIVRERRILRYRHRSENNGTAAERNAKGAEFLRRGNARAEYRSDWSDAEREAYARLPRFTEEEYRQWRALQAELADRRTEQRTRERRKLADEAAHKRALEYARTH